MAKSKQLRYVLALRAVAFPNETRLWTAELQTAVGRGTSADISRSFRGATEYKHGGPTATTGKPDQWSGA